MSCSWWRILDKIKNMKITCFIASLGGGGAEHQMAILADMLFEKGHEVTLVTYNNIPDHYTVSPSVKRVRLNVVGSKIQKQFSIMKYLLIADMDALISFREQMNFIALWPMLFRPMVRVIVGERNFTIGKPTKYLRFNMAFLYRRAQWIVPNNFSQENFIASHAPHLKKKLKTIINYTDLNKYTPVDCPADDSVRKIGVFARFYPQKNYERFAMAIATLKERGYIPFKVTWYGNTIDKDGNESEGYLKMCSLVSQYDIANYIELKPAVKDVHAEFHLFHALCLPSLFEGFSNSIAEGICSGKLMLVSDVSDNGVMVKENYNGFLFDPNDIESICGAMTKFLNADISTIKAMGANSRKMAENLFDKERFITDYMNLLDINSK